MIDKIKGMKLETLEYHVMTPQGPSVDGSINYKTPNEDKLKLRGITSQEYRDDVFLKTLKNIKPYGGFAVVFASVKHIGD